MKDLVISAIANYLPEKIQIYIESLNRSGFTGDKVMICYNIPKETVDYLKSNGWECYGMELHGHPHMRRLIDMWYFLNTTHLRKKPLKKNQNNYNLPVSKDEIDKIKLNGPLCAQIIFKLKEKLNSNILLKYRSDSSIFLDLKKIHKQLTIIKTTKNTQLYALNSND